MGIFKRKSQPSGTPGDTEEKAEETQEEMEQPMDESRPDACPDCKGEGLIGDPYSSHRICDKCYGKGYIESTMPEGTQIFKPEGKYIVRNGRLVKEN